MRWYDVLALFVLVVGAIFVLLFAVAVDIANHEPTPVPYVTPSPGRLGNPLR